MRTLLRCTLLAMLLVPSTAHAQAPAPADDETPIVVGDQRIRASEVIVSTLNVANLPNTGERLIRRAWMEREAAARGLTADPERVDAVFRVFAPIADRGTPDQLRAEIGDALLEEAVDETLLREARGNPQAYGASWAALEARERAVTTCTAHVAPLIRDWCANQRPIGPACSLVGRADVCRHAYRGQAWGGQVDLIGAFLELTDAWTAAVDPQGDDALARLRRYLGAHYAAAARHCRFESADEAMFTCSTRAYAYDVAFAVARIHATAKARWAVPAVGGLLR